MKRIMLTGLLAVMALTFPLRGYASGLVPEQCTIGDRPVYSPIIEIGFTFDGAIGVAENSVATIYSDGQPVETGALSCSNFVWEKRTQGTALISFETPLLLPKGKAYSLVVPEGAIFKEGNPDISNERLSVDFVVPATLEHTYPSIEDGSTVEYAQRIGFYFTTETAPVEGREIILYRESVPVRAYPCDVSWDWDLGYAGVDFGERINFEAGVRYSLLLPEGSVSALNRADIVNEQVSIDFIGSYEEPQPYIRYVWCSLYDNHPDGVLGEVMFFYDREIALSCNPKVQLTVDDKTVVKEVVPVLSFQNGQWVLTADFEGFPLVDGKGYSVVIPEGTIVTPDGDVAVNPHSVMSVGGGSAVGYMESAGPKITISNGQLRVEGLICGTKVTVCSIDGCIFYSAAAGSDNISIHLPQRDAYILSIDGKAVKIINNQ